MEVRRLAWAGLEISAGGRRLVIDLVEDFSRLHGGVTIARALQSGAPVLRPERASGRESETALVGKRNPRSRKATLRRES